MVFPKVKEKTFRKRVKKVFGNEKFQRCLIGIITVLVSFAIVFTAASPTKYKLVLGDKSPYDITAPRDIENKMITEQNRNAASDAVTPEMKIIGTASIDVINNEDDFMNAVETARNDISKSMQEQGITRNSRNYKSVLALEQGIAANQLTENVKTINVPLSSDQIKYLVSKATDDEITEFKKVTNELVSEVMKEDITEENLASKVDKVQSEFQSTNLDQDLKNIGSMLSKAILKPNRTIDSEATELKRQKAYDDKMNIEMIPKDARIISVGETVTADKLAVIRELNLLETSSRIDVGFGAGILVIILLLTIVLVIYMDNFCKTILKRRKDLILLSLIIITTLLLAWGLNSYSPLAIPIFIAAMLISILLDVKLAAAVNVALTITISLITKGNLNFISMAVIGGTFSVFLVSRANQRSKLSAAGLFIAVINAIVILCIGGVDKSSFSTIAGNCLIVFLNGIASMVITIGTLPFWESGFNIITPMKLLELANPNQPLVKRLLLEAPGTYHHSLMVGNMAEVATEAIGGNSLLARVGAYFHDIGKLKRPNFFKENQLSENPHDRMTANLSTLVITSHTHDGVELAEKYKIPLAIREIIQQHHGTTLVAYFYHKARKGEKGETVKPENFRYEGPKPLSNEAAVVMLADSVEAAVRALPDKTEGKIEGLVRKIIKDKLDDGQLDCCELTLKDLNVIAQSFMKVFSGLFHEREEYPEEKIKMQDMEIIKIVDPLEETAEYKQPGNGENTEDSESITSVRR
ncbi:MAG: HDIG domain-containing protein [Bacillota bacterium]|nr:HDIG domain-containing protein [Bacillota bacterium]